MKDLSPFAKQLVKAGRDAYQPAAADKLRVREALSQRLPAAPQSPGDPSVAPKPPVAPPTAPWPLLSIAAVGTAVVAGALYWGLSSPSESSREATLPAVVTPKAQEQLAPSEPPRAPRSKAPSSEEAKPPTVDTIAPEKAEKGPAASAKVPEETHRRNRLAEEVALLSKATSALNAGRAQEALNTLAEHQRKFPHGVLTVERRAARAQALCLLGRKTEAERELEGLSPSSPQAVQARQLCRDK